MVIWATPSRLLPKGELKGGIFFEDAQKHDILEATKEIHCPLMIIHGHGDEEVNFRHALELYKRARPPKGLKIIKGGDHTFTNLIHRNTVIDITLNWLDKYL
jgi:dipeptidyl aminopeptidase/acylaminoacyl peptidase